MARLIMAILATVALVAFSMANTHQVELSLVFGRPTEIRLISLMGATFGTGLLTGVLWGMIRRLKKAEGPRPKLQLSDTHDLLKD
ncbi:MAG: DUF1049 domain-containing protein [Deltaproteobacteria bacterium]|nr:DUF1049 domain-containing protein [Deltaproteobacteria bacterium]